MKKHTNKKGSAQYGHSQSGRKFVRIGSGGFTIIEALVAVTILVTAVVGPLTMAQRGLSTSVFAKDQITAFYLAQDLVENVLRTRANNSINGNPWLTGLSSCVNTICSGGIIEQEHSGKLVWGTKVCTGGAGTCDKLKFNESSGLYGYSSSWVDSRFNREFTLTEISSNEMQLNIKVTWTTGALTKEINIQENLLDWH